MVDVVVFSPEEGDVLLIRRDKNLTKDFGPCRVDSSGWGMRGASFRGIILVPKVVSRAKARGIATQCAYRYTPTTGNSLSTLRC